MEANIGNLNTLLDSYERINSTAPESASLSETIEELQATLGLLETDLEDLEECVRVVEDHGDRWGLGSSEVRERRVFVDRVSRNVEVGFARSLPLIVSAAADSGKGCFAKKAVQQTRSLYGPRGAG